METNEQYATQVVALCRLLVNSSQHNPDDEVVTGTVTGANEQQQEWSGQTQPKKATPKASLIQRSGHCEQRCTQQGTLQTGPCCRRTFVGTERCGMLQQHPCYKCKYQLNRRKNSCIRGYNCKHNMDCKWSNDTRVSSSQLVASNRDPRMVLGKRISSVKLIALLLQRTRT